MVVGCLVLYNSVDAIHGAAHGSGSSLAVTLSSPLPLSARHASSRTCVHTSNTTRPVPYALSQHRNLRTQQFIEASSALRSDTCASRMLFEPEFSHTLTMTSNTEALTTRLLNCSTLLQVQHEFAWYMGDYGLY